MQLKNAKRERVERRQHSVVKWLFDNVMQSRNDTEQEKWKASEWPTTLSERKAQIKTLVWQQNKLTDPGIVVHCSAVHYDDLHDRVCRVSLHPRPKNRCHKCWSEHLSTSDALEFYEKNTSPLVKHSVESIMLQVCGISLVEERIDSNKYQHILRTDITLCKKYWQWERMAWTIRWS